jgi:alginate O-acetyltransferase complex protein AlgI
MIFNELSYFLLFLLPCVALFHRSEPRWRPWVISLFGVLFFVYYGYLHFGGRWGALCVLLFVWEIATSRLYRTGSRWCIAGIVQAVLILVGFKYLTFATGAWNDLARIASLPPLRPLDRIVLPLGVSFFTFEFIHFAADSYRGRVERPALGEYAAFILFFPTMVAGPIKRIQDFLPKLREATFSPQLATQGVTRILAGLAKKHVLADTLTLWSDNLVGDGLYTASGGQILLWLLAYGGKIYFDFSAYSDIAIGSGYLFGLRIPENFNWPYSSADISEFWRRWHISLSNWIRDYVYIPLGGSRDGERRTALNLFVAFGVSGLWHGAAYNFLAWGLWHGLLLVGHRLWSKAGRALPRPVAIALTFGAVNVGWAFFSMDIGRATYALGRVAGLRGGN